MNNTIILLVILLIGTNLKPIKTYIEWLRFRLKTMHKQRKYERNNQTNNRSRIV
jgi:hypothetical protein